MTVKRPPVTVRELLKTGLNEAVYVLDGDSREDVPLAPTDSAYKVARERVVAETGRSRVPWQKEGKGSAGTDPVWWAEFPIGDGRVVGWFTKNPAHKKKK
jgi:hypothetical protein